MFLPRREGSPSTGLKPPEDLLIMEHRLVYGGIGHYGIPLEYKAIRDMQCDVLRSSRVLVKKLLMGYVNSFTKHKVMNIKELRWETKCSSNKFSEGIRAFYLTLCVV